MAQHATTAPVRRARHARPARLGHLTAVVVISILGVALACSSPQGQGGPSDANPAPSMRLASALVPFDACEDLLAFVKKEATDRVGPFGLSGDGGASATPAQDGARSTQGPVTTVATARAEGAPVPDAPSANSSSANSSPTSPASASAKADDTGGVVEHSDTNVQEAGVDEPDTVKTDGARILAVTGTKLVNVDVRGATPVIAGSITVPGSGGTQILVGGNHVLAIDPNPQYSPDSPVAADAASMPAPGTSLSLIDVADPAAMKILSIVRVGGSFVSARMVDGEARVVTSFSPSALGFVYPSTRTPAAEQAAEAANQKIIADSKIEDWLPSVEDIPATTPSPTPPGSTKRTLIDCAKMSHPKTFSGFSTLAVLSLDISGARVDPGDAVGVMADGHIAYASKDNLYVATPRYVETPKSTPLGSGGSAQPTTTIGPTTAVPFGTTTAIHKFSLPARGPALYQGSGEVGGGLLNQFSMSENDGFLRVVTTTGSTTSCSGCTSRASETFMRVLAARDGELVEIGSVGDMGHGEQVKSVRFIGTQAYVVTFRRTDPLYTLDLSTPTDPKVVGTLKILGYSAYLHPAGDGLLIGVGQDATEQGRALGTKVALFDVSDLAKPRELQSYVLSSSTSQVEEDFHAFLWWGQTRLAVVPVERAYLGGGVSASAGSGGAPESATPFTGAVGLTVDRDGIAELGRIVNPSQPAPVPVPVPGDPCGGGPSIRCSPNCPPGALCATASPAPSAVPTTRAGPAPLPVRPTPPINPDPGARIDRTLVVGDTLYSFSANGLRASDLATLQQRSWLPFS